MPLSILLHNVLHGAYGLAHYVNCSSSVQPSAWCWLSWCPRIWRVLSLACWVWSMCLPGGTVGSLSILFAVQGLTTNSATLRRTLPFVTSLIILPRPPWKWVYHNHGLIQVESIKLMGLKCKQDFYKRLRTDSIGPHETNIDCWCHFLEFMHLNIVISRV